MFKLLKLSQTMQTGVNSKVIKKSSGMKDRSPPFSGLLFAYETWVNTRCLLLESPLWVSIGAHFFEVLELQQKYQGS